MRASVLSNGLPALALVMVLAALLTACVSAPPHAAPISVAVPVHEPCVLDEPAVPAWAVAALRTGQPIGEQVKALMVERAQRIAYESRLLAVIEGCR